MTLEEIIQRVDAVKLNAFPVEIKLAWLGELDGKLALEVLRMHSSEAQQFRYGAEQLHYKPLVAFPHDSLYDAWLYAKIDLANGEMDRYANSMALFEGLYKKFVVWFLTFYDPAHGYEEVSNGV